MIITQSIIMTYELRSSNRLSLFTYSYFCSKRGSKSNNPTGHNELFFLEGGNFISPKCSLVDV